MNLQKSLLPQHHFVFSGKSGEYFKIWLSNLLLTLVTLGIYSAWATVRRRRYFYQNTEIAGENFAYHARPLQILIGRLILVAALIVFFIADVFFPSFANFLLLLFFLLLPLLAIRSWRFQARMSSYRGVHFDYRCPTGKAYGHLLVLPMLMFIGLCVLIAFYLYFVLASDALNLLPWGVPGLFLFFFIAMSFIQAIGSQLSWSLYVNHHFYGSYAFSAALSKKTFLRIMLVSLLILVPFIAFSLGLATFLMIEASGGVQVTTDNMHKVMSQASSSVLWAYTPVLAGFWFSSNYLFIAVRNYLFRQTTVGEKLRLYSTLSYFAWIKIQLGNLLLIVFTLGLAIPLAQIRCARYLAERCWLEGELPETDKADGATEKVMGAIAEEFVPVEGIDVGL